MIFTFSKADTPTYSIDYQSEGYPHDTIWYSENGKLKDRFALEEIRFKLGSAELVAKNDSVSSLWSNNYMYEQLDSLAVQIQKDGGMFVIENHSDCRGSKYASANYSTARARSVAAYLVSQGVDSTKLDYRGYGDYFPRKKGGTLLTCEFINSIESLETIERMHQLNRRTEISRKTNH